VTIAFKAVCEVAFNTLGMECLAIEDITLTVFQVRGIVALVAFTDLAINTVTKTTSLRTMRYIADNTSPAKIAPAHIRSNRKTIYTRRITDWV
jgi:hypothetical protein